MEIKDEHDAVAKMTFIEELVERAVVPYRESIEAAVVAGGIMRIARRLIRLYPPTVQRDLIEGACAFLEGRDVEGEQQTKIILGSGPETTH